MESINPVDDILTELAVLYKQVKSAYILLEENNPDQSAYMGPINEFRNSLDHVMKILYKKHEIDYCKNEFNGAKSHLLRAGCDSYEFVCSEIIIFIDSLIYQYTAEEIVSVLPDYYDIRIKVIEVQEKIAEYREIKELKIESSDPNIVEKENIFNYYKRATLELIQYKKAILQKLPFIIECHKKNKRDKNIMLFLAIIGSVIGIAGVIIALVK